MNKKLLFNLAYWIMIVAVIGTCVFLVVYLKSNGKDCLADPIQYYAQKTGENCFCMSDFLK